MNDNRKKVVLCILDGWGCTDSIEHNAIHSANAPFFRKLMNEAPHALLEASGEYVGLPAGQIGNSEVGHLTIGAGRRIDQDLPRIDRDLKNGTLYKDAAITSMISDLARTKKACHLIGIASDGGVHGHIQHLISLGQHIKAAGVRVLVHAILDGRDVAPRSAHTYLKQLQEAGLEIATISGRFYAMDRDKRAQRTQAAFECIVYGKGEEFTDPLAYLNSSYSQEVSDEHVIPASSQNYGGFAADDGVFFTNFRADRMRQICAAITTKEFTLFSRQQPELSHKIIMRPYSDDIAANCDVLLPYEPIYNTLGEVISEAGFAQLRLAETEKYAHVTYFFNGGSETPNIGEDRILIPSPKVETYDATPAMSAYEITHTLADALDSGQYDFVCVNYANADMVGHTGDMSATVAAIEALDICLQGVADTCRRNGYHLLITSDHGNAECMYDESIKQPLTAHTTNKVPLIYVGYRKLHLSDGELADIGPTVLDLMGIPAPTEMTGKSRLV